MIAARFALAFTLLALVAPAAAVAQTDSPFAPLPPAPAPQQDVPITGSNSATDNNDNGGLQRWQELLIFLGGGILLVGIGWAIVSDARKSAPVEERDSVATAKAAREQDRHRRKEHARAKGKAARAARRHNR